MKWEVGDRVDYQWDDSGKWYTGRILHVNENYTYLIKDDYNFVKDHITPEQVRRTVTDHTVIIFFNLQRPKSEESLDVSRPLGKQRCKQLRVYFSSFFFDCFSDTCFFFRIYAHSVFAN